MGAGGHADEAAGGAGRLRISGLVLGALALTAFFMVLDFPYDRLARRIADGVEQQTGARIALSEVSLGWVRWAPGLTARGVQVIQPDGTRLELERVGVRPALDFAWLRGDPALATDVASARGGGSGVLTLGDASAFDGEITDLDLELLPQQQLGASLHVKGRSDAEVDLVLGEEGPVGHVDFEARDGIVTHPELPLPMPFQKLTGKIDLGGDEIARIRELTLESPLASGRARGTIGRAPSFASAPLRLQLELTVSGAIRGSLNTQGVEVGNSGEIRVDVTGTPARPVVR